MPNTTDPTLSGKRQRRRIARWGLPIMLLLIAADVWLYPHFVRPPRGVIPGRDHAIWIRHTWFDGKHSEEESYALAKRLGSCGIRHVYLHAGWLYADGTLPLDQHDLSRPRQLIRILHEVNPELVVHAWIFGTNAAFRVPPAAGGKVDYAGGLVDLARREVRQGIVRAAARLVEEVGFAGIHYDIEPLRGGDENYLRLVEETRARVGEKVLLSVCSIEWRPDWLPVARMWPSDYYHRMGQVCDQIALMHYDTYLSSPRVYVWLTQLQTRAIAASLADTDCHLYVGVPSYDSEGWRHQARVESLAHALRGVGAALRRPDFPCAHFGGVALFAEWTTDESEWAVWQAALAE